MNTRKLSQALSHEDVRTISAAAHAAQRLELPLTALITVHFGALASPPQCPAEYLRTAVIAKFNTWLRRHHVTWTALWVRENFTGPRREHVHLLVHVPRKAWAPFRAALLRWWPEENAVHIRGVYNIAGAVCYLSKQLSTQASFAVGRRIRRQSHCSKTGARVAPVLGRRFSMTRNLRAHISGGPRINRRA